MTTDLPVFDKEIVEKTFDRCTCIVRTFAPLTPHGDRPFSQIVNIVNGHGTRYHDKGAACNCSDIALYRWSDEVFTVCKLHGVKSIGYLRPVIVLSRGRNQ